MTSISSTPTTKEIWDTLCDHIRRSNGAMIHPELELREMASDHRGVFTRNAIRYGETLIRLPLSCAIHGQDMPIEYSVGQGTKRQASTWLRCLAALYRYQRGNSAKNDAYLQSLPHQFETLWSWSQEEVDSFLAGTSACLHVAEIGEDRVNSWYIDVAAVEARYQEHVRPYLEQHCQLNSTYDAFSRACQIISTRAFHLASASQDYSGPFLLPVIDLLNHSAVDPLTTLRFEQGAFIMKAEDNIPAHFEIKHSYGTELTARESLRTFGFVAMEDTLAVLEGTERYSCSIPVIVAKQDVLEACWNVIESSVPQQLAQSMQEMDLDDEAWKMPRDYRNRNTDFYPTTLSLGPDILCLTNSSPQPVCRFYHFLLIKKSSNFFGGRHLGRLLLGKLVSTSLLRVLSDRMAAYKAIYYEGKEFNDDHELLKLLLDVKEDLSLQQKRLVYGLTVRLREKQTWTALRRKVCEILTQLDDEEEETEDDNMKRQRMDVT